MIAVIDTSALLRLIIPDGPVPDGLQPYLQACERGDHSAIAPDLIWVEAANVLNKKCRNEFLTHVEAQHALTLLLRMPIRTLQHHEYLSSALKLAAETSLTVYDAIFLAVARKHGAKLFTADDRLARAAGMQTG